MYSSVPPSVTTSPLARVMVLGYQRPARMLAARPQVPLRKLKMLESLDPWKSLWWPPDTIRLPSGRKACPLQKRSVLVFGTCVNAPVAGSHRNTSVVLCAWWSSLVQARTFPFGSSVRWLEMILNRTAPTMHRDAGWRLRTAACHPAAPLRAR